ncbi:PEP-CTERM sorting domain-containing protein [Nostoc paludosum FACHB-159]|uniref:PEP-CTERM sorting domain-containing protein n=2 Tax=Nostoc TaxID=1177 RepID=A0ABR8K3V9_9NOSO|nr:PEP-CTERM sorting domain-containing protein [Nostoc sp. FACHB-857]MBD2733526.1 PEP-CTERM sorting domain-containing protein [Nostoc paludosum FACHB-159]
MSTTAQALTVIDFESLAQPGDGITSQGFSYTEDGYTLTNTNINEFPFAIFNIGEPRYLGSTALFNDTPNGTIILNKSDGGAFDLLSIDLGELNEPFESSTVTFVGVKADNSTISNTFTLNGVKGFQTFNFTNFTNIISTSWQQVDPFHQFDNIVISDSTTTSVPEPTSILGLLSFAAIGLGSALTYKKAAT